MEAIKRIIGKISSRTLATMIVGGVIALIILVCAIGMEIILFMAIMAGAVGFSLYIVICLVEVLIDEIREGKNE